MGESCIRGNVSHGDGVYRSTDARQDLDAPRPGRHAPHLESPRPSDATRTWCTSPRWATPTGRTSERGIFRSRDGGKTWEHVLFRSPDAGANDLSMDPHNPRVLYASFWEARRGRRGA